MRLRCTSALSILTSVQEAIEGPRSSLPNHLETNLEITQVTLKSFCSLPCLFLDAFRITSLFVIFFWISASFLNAFEAVWQQRQIDSPNSLLLGSLILSISMSALFRISVDLSPNCSRVVCFQSWDGNDRLCRTPVVSIDNDTKLGSKVPKCRSC